jgi:hypothetical protein
VVVVPAHELRGAGGELRGQIGKHEDAALDQLPQGFLCRPAGGAAEQVDRLGERRPARRGRHRQRVKRLATAFVVGLAGIDERYERPGVGQRQFERRRSDSKSVKASPVCRARPPSE